MGFIGLGLDIGSAHARKQGGGAPESGVIETSSLSVLDYGDGASLTMPAARDAFQWADGSWGIISGSDVVISGDAPASQDDANGFLMNGLVLQSDLEIKSLTSDGNQGHEEIVDSANVASLNKNYCVDFAAAKNKAPSATAANLTLATTGGSGVAVKTVRTDPLPLSGSDYDVTSMLEKIMVVSAVPEAPLVGAIRPPMIGGLASLINLSDFDWTRVRSFTLPGDLPNIEEDCLAYVQSPQLTFITEGEYRRSLCVGQDYAQFIVTEWLVPAALYMMKAHADSDTETRDAFAAAFAVRATDAYGSIAAGRPTQGGAGQHGADHFCIALVAALCPELTALATTAKAWRSNFNDQAFWATSDVVGLPTDFNILVGAGSNSRHNCQPVLPEHVGYQVWNSSGQSDPTYSIEKINTANTARYDSIAFDMAIAGATALGLVEGGWEMIWGDQSSWDTDNDRFATLQRLDQRRLHNDTPFFAADSNRANPYVITLWDAHRATFPEGGTPVAIQHAPPTQLTLDLEGSGVLTETASGVDIDYFTLHADASEFTGSTLALTDRKIRRSHDGIQWSAGTSIDATDSFAFTGTQWLSEQRSNALGASAWSPNWPLYNGTTAALRNVMTGGSIPSGSPVNTEAPKVYTYAYDEETKFWAYEEETATMDVDREILLAGVGLYADGIDHSLTTYQWQSRENAGSASNITDATEATWTRDPDLLSDAVTTRDVRVVVTVDDGNGNTTTTNSGWVTMPEVVDVTEDFSTDQGVLSPSVGDESIAWQEGDESIRVTLNEAYFGGVIVPVTGLVKGATYTLECEYSAVSTARVRCDVGSTPGDDDLASALYAEGLTAPGTITLSFVAETSTVYVLPKANGTPDPGDSFDVTRIDALNPNDVTAPSLSSPIDAEDSSAASTWAVTTDEGNGTLYWVITTSATAPSAAQVKAGQDHTGSAAASSGSEAVTETGEVTGAGSGLSAETTYYTHFMHEDAAENQSSVASADGFTTDAAPVSSPVFVGTTASTGSNPTETISLTGLTGGTGSSPQEGDIVLIWSHAAGASDRAPDISTSGYTNVFDIKANNGFPNSDSDFRLDYKIMGATPDTSVDVTATADAATAFSRIVEVWRNVDPTTPIDVAAQTSTDTGNTDAVLPAISPATSNAVVLTAAAIAVNTDTAATVTPGAGLSNVQNKQTVSVNAADSSTVFIGSYEWSSGEYTPPALTVDRDTSEDSWAAATIALRPSS